MSLPASGQLPTLASYPHAIFVLDSLSYLWEKTGLWHSRITHTYTHHYYCIFSRLFFLFDEPKVYRRKFFGYRRNNNQQPTANRPQNAISLISLVARSSLLIIAHQSWKNHPIYYYYTHTAKNEKEGKKWEQLTCHRNDVMYIQITQTKNERDKTKKKRKSCFLIFFFRISFKKSHDKSAAQSKKLFFFQSTRWWWLNSTDETISFFLDYWMQLNLNDGNVRGYYDLAMEPNDTDTL